MKTLKTTRLNLYLVYLNTNIKPSDYADAEEMKVLMGDVRPVMKEEILDFLASTDKSMDLQRKFQSGDMTQKDFETQATALNKEMQRTELKIGNEEVSVVFENDAFNKFISFYNRTGKNWFQTAERYMEFDEDMNEANKQVKE